MRENHSSGKSIESNDLRYPTSEVIWAKTCDFAYFEETFLLIFKHCVRKGSFKRDWSSFCEKENLKKDRVGRDSIKTDWKANAHKR